MITSIEILTAEQCAHVRSVVHELREFWIPRGQPPHPFFTLGVASYIDASEPSDINNRYYSRAHQYNSILKEHFDWLYTIVRAVLEEYLGSPTSYKEDFALPGFHIWLSSAIITKPTASIHFDLQYLKLHWQASDKPDFTRQVSFTLPIRLPMRGGGLNVWDLSYEEFINAYNRGLVTSIPEMQRFKTMTFYPYTPGTLVLHSGHLLHQIAPTAEVQDTDERITLQGHVLYCDGQWKFYW